MAHQNILGHSVPEDGVEDVIRVKIQSRLFSYDKIRKTSK